MKMLAYAQLLRLDKPIGVLLVLWPTLTALWLAKGGVPNWQYIAIFTAGAIIVRSAGCIINDICDRKFDGAVTRTANRPLVAQTVSLTEAIVLLLLLLVLALWLVLQLNTYSLLLAAIACCFTAIYPLFKRFTYFPQLFLAITINFGIFIAFAATQNQLPVLAFAVFGCAFLWTVIYDSMYAKVDLEDDLKIGVKSSAIAFGTYFTPILLALRIAMFAAMVGVGMIAQLQHNYYIALALVAAYLIAEFCYTLAGSRQRYMTAFKHSHILGLLWLLAVMYD